MAGRQDLRSDQRPSRGAKKLIESALLQIVQEGQTSDEWLIKIHKAKMVNEALGGPFVAPWEVEDVPDEVLERIQAVAEDLPGMREGQRQVEEVRERWKRSLEHK